MHNGIPLDSNSLVKYYMLDMTNNIKSSTKKPQTYIQKEKQKLFAKVWGLLKYVEDRESIIWQFSSFSWEFWINEDFPFFPKKKKKMHILLFSHALGVICCYVFVHVFDLVKNRMTILFIKSPCAVLAEKKRWWLSKPDW